jgi:AraC family transcriptional regulator of adaptative response/methylated-DNA-[protein]-cysteine methyltransferase
METINGELSRMSADYALIEQAIRYIETHQGEQPSLKQVADDLHMSEFHFQRLFTRWVGISPKRFMQYLTKEYAKQLLDRSHNLLEVAYRSGLSGPGRLHDLFVTWEAVTPGDYKRKGEGLRLAYGFHPSPFGECLLAASPRGVTNLVFVDRFGRRGAFDLLRREWPLAELHEDPSATRELVEQAYGLFTNRPAGRLSLHLRGTNFQLKVWEGLLQIPAGTVVAYEDLAVSIGLPGAARAVGQAVGRNPVAVIIPCHRVIRKSGEPGGYRWGLARKHALLGWEAARQEQAFRPAGQIVSV